jgi:phosphopantothenoylcysteine decarboxylase/phosphopantothenate--cysteine ligase
MGFDIAKSAANFGASVILVSGPTHLQVSHLLIKVINVVSAEEMYDTCQLYYNDVDVAIAAAAVADYKPKNVANHKIKKSS